MRHWGYGSWNETLTTYIYIVYFTNQNKLYKSNHYPFSAAFLILSYNTEANFKARHLMKIVENIYETVSVPFMQIYLTVPFMWI